MLAFAVYLIGSVAIPPANAGQSAPGPAPAEAGAGACPSLTSEAIQTAIDRIALSRVKAASDAAVHGVEGGPGYPSAARDNVVYLDLAHDKMVTLLDWLHSADLLDPPGYVSNATGAYNVHGYVRESVTDLHYARHWATVSAVAHTSADARSSYELTTQALDLLETLGAQAGRCYMDGYGPFN